MADKAASLLLIDDEDIVRESMAAYLEDCGFTIFEAADGEQGLAQFQQHQPDVVLCDLKMPRIDGLGVLEALSESSPNTPVIVISGVGVMSDVVQALRLGASDYLIKPIADMEVLEYAISRCLAQAKLLRENEQYKEQLEAANTELETNISALQQDLIAGRQVQMKMLPPAPVFFDEYRFSHRIVPSLYLSGDFVDYFRVGDDHVAFCIADVSGHGASSAFITVLLKNIFARKRSDFLHRGDMAILSPSEMLDFINQEILKTQTGKHATLCVGVVDLTEDSMQLSIAGHLPLPILAADGKCEYIVSEDVPAGLFEEASYTEKTLLLPENFILSLFSDGILEVLPAEGIRAKEALLLDSLSSGINTVKALSETFHLDQLKDAPDDIAILLISKNSEN